MRVIMRQLEGFDACFLENPGLQVRDLPASFLGSELRVNRWLQTFAQTEKLLVGDLLYHM